MINEFFQLTERKQKSQIQLQHVSIMSTARYIGLFAWFFVCLFDFLRQCFSVAFKAVLELALEEQDGLEHRGL